MNPTFSKIVSGAGIGFATALVVDVIIWLRTPGGWRVTGFDWDVASKRWVLGAFSGGASAAGIHLQG